MHAESTRRDRWCWLWTILAVAIICSGYWTTGTVTYRLAFFLVIGGLDEVAPVVNAAAFILAAVSLVLVACCLALHLTRQLTRLGFRSTLVLIVAVFVAAEYAYLSRTERARESLSRYCLILGRRGKPHFDAWESLGRLRAGTVSAGESIYVMPIDRTRIIEVHDFLEAEGYDVSYADPEWIETIKACVSPATQPAERR